jgi:hypothetical protein
MASVSDELKEFNILKLILIVRFACATLNIRHPIFISAGDSSLPHYPFVISNLNHKNIEMSGWTYAVGGHELIPDRRCNQLFLFMG